MHLLWVEIRIEVKLSFFRPMEIVNTNWLQLMLLRLNLFLHTSTRKSFHVEDIVKENAMSTTSLKTVGPCFQQPVTHITTNPQQPTTTSCTSPMIHIRKSLIPLRQHGQAGQQRPRSSEKDLAWSLGTKISSSSVDVRATTEYNVTAMRLRPGASWSPARRR